MRGDGAGYLTKTLWIIDLHNLVTSISSRVTEVRQSVVIQSSVVRLILIRFDYVTQTREEVMAGDLPSRYRVRSMQLTFTLQSIVFLFFLYLSHRYMQTKVNVNVRSSQSKCQNLASFKAVYYLHFYSQSLLSRSS